MNRPPARPAFTRARPVVPEAVRGGARRRGIILAAVPDPAMAVVCAAPHRPAVQVIRYGRIDALPVRDGQPDLSQPLHWMRAVKVTGTNAPHPGTTSPDAGLPHELVRFFQLLEALGTGVVHDVEIRDGLPMAFNLHEGGAPPA